MLLVFKVLDRPERRTTIFARYKIDIATLSETRLNDEDYLTEIGSCYTY